MGKDLDNAGLYSVLADELYDMGIIPVDTAYVAIRNLLNEGHAHNATVDMKKRMLGDLMV